MTGRELASDNLVPIKCECGELTFLHTLQLFILLYIHRVASRMRRAAAIERFIEKVSGYTEVFQEFSEEAWLGLAEKIIVKDKGSYIVQFKNGIEIPVEA